MTVERRIINEGYIPREERGYKPAERPVPDSIPTGNPGAGYQPTVNETGNAPGNPPKKP